MDNRYSIYQKIRQDRTYRTLGKMSWWRILLGLLLLVLVLLISGTPSQWLASGGNFRLAEKLMISPAWMEKYKPETKAYIEAGVLYQDGDFAGALDSFGKLGDGAAAVMESLSAEKLAFEKLSAGEYDGAYAAATEVTLTLLPEDSRQEYLELCSALYVHFSTAGGGEARAQTLLDVLEAQAETASG